MNDLIWFLFLASMGVIILMTLIDFIAKKKGDKMGEIDLTKLNRFNLSIFCNKEQSRTGQILRESDTGEFVRFKDVERLFSPQKKVKKFKMSKAFKAFLNGDDLC